MLNVKHWGGALGVCFSGNYWGELWVVGTSVRYRGNSGVFTLGFCSQFRLKSFATMLRNLEFVSTRVHIELRIETSRFYQWNPELFVLPLFSNSAQSSDRLKRIFRITDYQFIVNCIYCRTKIKSPGLLVMHWLLLEGIVNSLSKMYFAAYIEHRWAE